MSDDASGARAGPRSGDTETEPAGFEAGVPDLARAATLSAALVAAAALAVVPVAAAVGFLGAVLVAVALSRRSGTLLDAGVGALVVGVLVAGPRARRSSPCSSRRPLRSSPTTRGRQGCPSPNSSAWAPGRGGWWRRGRRRASACSRSRPGRPTPSIGSPRARPRRRR
ncbi:DUF7519 family protein [Halosegnis marinus]|uniref:DUF7519 family protein n=1 Tax=Halosegnis marinus TaxID=3034023 RepID=UPI00360BC245